MTRHCCLCGNTNEADLGRVIGICLDADACRERQYQAREQRRESQQRKQPKGRARGYSGYRLPPGRRGSTT
jgi:hypothetical protein